MAIVVDELGSVNQLSDKKQFSSEGWRKTEEETCTRFNHMTTIELEPHTFNTIEHGRKNVPDRTRVMIRKKLSRRMNLENSVRESIWLWDSRHGIDAKEIAIREGVSVRRVQFGLARARSQEVHSVQRDLCRPPRLVPLFPVGPYTPQSLCGHHQPIERGSVFCCMICHTSGQDDHPALQRDPRIDPRRDTKPASSQKAFCSEKTYRETRRQRRQRLFGAQL